MGLCEGEGKGFLWLEHDPQRKEVCRCPSLSRDRDDQNPVRSAKIDYPVLPSDDSPKTLRKGQLPLIPCGKHPPLPYGPQLVDPVVVDGGDRLSFESDPDRRAS